MAIRRNRLQHGSSEIGQIDPLTKRTLKAGDLVIECGRGHVWLEESWDFMGGRCSLCGATVNGSIKKEEPGADTRAYTRPLESPVRGGTTGSTAAILLGIAICAAVTIGGIIAVATMSRGSNNKSIQPVTVVKTVIVEVPGNNKPEFIAITPPPRLTNTPHPANTHRPATSSPGSSSHRTNASCPGALGPSFEIGDRFVVPYGDGPTFLFRSPNAVPKVATLYEGTGGIILDGPVCVRGREGNLLSWYVEADSGTRGWVSEGYTHSPVPWIEPDN